ncbi:MAG: alpha-amylase family protein [Gemmataceae bacterium]
MTTDAFLPSRREALVLTAAVAVLPRETPAAPVQPPDWVRGVTRMTFCSPGEVAKAARAGAQVIHTNIVWPYFPLRRDGGGLAKDDAPRLQALVADCRRAGVRLVLGLPPFPPVELVKQHPDWRVRPDTKPVTVEPDEKNLGTRLGCNLGPWGDYLIDVCVELTQDYHLDGFSFDGNYHAALCHCPACTKAYARPIPAKINLDDVAYREYLVWRGERLEDHYRAMQQRLKRANPGAVLMSWTVNAGRYGHFLHSPRAMPTRVNLLFDLPMQEWWLDETNLGGSVAPAFGAAYLRAVAGGRPCASEPYLMSRVNPYGTDSFPAHERLTRCLLALSHGSVLAESMGWPGHDVAADFQEVAKRDRFLTGTKPLPWAALLVSEQTRQFYAYRDIPERFLAHQFGAFRAATEEHLPLTLINDWDVTAEALAPYSVVLLANAAALSDGQAAALRQYVQAGGGLVATGETSLCDELGRPRKDFALADLFGVSYRGRPKVPLQRPKLDENFAISLDENYWKQRTGVATLTWGDHPLLDDRKLRELVPRKSVIFRGPLVAVSEPALAEVAVRMKPEGTPPPLPAAVLRQVGKGRVAYFAAALDAALWNYAYPYQRRLLALALHWAAREAPTVSVAAPMCVQATYFTQTDATGRRVLVHLFNGVNTAANHGLPAAEVPLREEVIPVHDIELTFHRDAPARFRCEPGGRPVQLNADGAKVVVTLPPLEIHAILVGER